MAATSAHPNFEPNVTPMLDVLLVLLIVFMSISIQIHRSVDVQLPDACTGTCSGGDQIVLEVRAGPEYRINTAAVAPSELASRLLAIYAPRPKKEIQIAGYPGARYDDVMHAMDVAKSAGVTVVGLAPKDVYLKR
jgi:biopolymer transport protein TolR